MQSFQSRNQKSNVGPQKSEVYLHTTGPQHEATQMLETVGQFGLKYIEQDQGTLGSLVATPSLLSRVIESQGQDAEIVSIRDRVQLGIGDEGWTIHVNGSLQYRGRVVVPQLIDLRDEM